MNNDKKSAASEKLREQAESRDATPGRDEAINEASDLKRLLHERQVHQVELEMQYAELYQAVAERNEMEALLGSYRDLYDFAPAGYFNLDPFGTIRAVNQTGAGFLGVRQSLLINSRLEDFISVETRPKYHDFLEKVFAGDEKKVCEVVFEREGHAQLVVQIEAVVSSSGEHCRAVVVDITRHKQSENELVKANLRMAALMEAVPVGISYSDDITSQNITGNPAVLKQFNVSTEDNLSASALDRDAPGRIIKFFLDGRQITDAELPLQRAVAENRVIPPMELKVLMPSGRQWYAEASAAPVRDTHGNIIGGIAVTEDITERKLAEQLLRENEERLRLILRAGSMGTFEIDLQSGEAHWDATMYELLGIQTEDILPGSETFFRYVHPDDAATLRTDWEEALHEGKLDAEFRIVRADGEERWLAGQGEFVFAQNMDGDIQNNQRKPLRFLGVNYDITSRKLVEQSLQRSKEEWERTFDSVPDLITILDNQHRIIKVNQAMANLLNCEPEQCVGLPCFTVMHGTNAPPSFCPHKRSLSDLQEHESLVEETIFGGVFLVSTTPLFDSCGEMYASMHVARDITRLTRAEKKLRENEERLRFHLENSPMAVVEWDRDFTVTRWTGESELIFGWSAAEVVGKPITDLNMIYEADVPLVERVVAQLTDGVSRQVVSTNRNITKNGEIRYCTWYNSVLMDQEGRISSVLSQVIDITERITAENELLKARNQLEQRVRERTQELETTLEILHAETEQRLQAVEALRRQELAMIQQNRHAAMGEMIGNIAHQWRQPLNTLGLFTQRLGFFYDSPEFNKDFLDTSVAKSMEIIQYLSLTIDDFRSFFSKDREKVEFRVDEMINRALSLVEAGFNEHKICVERDASENVTIYGFPNEYAQVLLNILLNAKDAIIERTIASPRVRIHSRNENGMAVVTIYDNAGGIPEDVITRVFDPYFTTKGPQQGTGIGLFMSKTIIENNMGGNLSVRNTDEGAEFRIEV